MKQNKVQFFFSPVDSITLTGFTVSVSVILLRDKLPPECNGLKQSSFIVGQSCCGHETWEQLNQVVLAQSSVGGFEAKWCLGLD